MKKFRFSLLFIFFVCCATLGFAIGYLFDTHLSPYFSENQSFTDIVDTILIALSLLWFSILVHETGHILAGLWRNMKFYGVSVWFLKLERQSDDKLHFGINREINVWGGLARMLPESSQNLRNDVAWMVAGGPIASILFGILLFFVFWQFKGQFLAQPLIIGSLTSVLIGLGSLIPYNFGSQFRSDGERLLALWKDDSDSRQDLAIMVIASSILVGKRPAEIDALLYDTLSLKHDNSLIDLSINQLLLYRAVDLEQTEQIDHLFERQQEMTALSSLPEGLRKELQTELDFLDALRKKDREAAEAALNAMSDSGYFRPWMDRLS